MRAIYNRGSVVIAEGDVTPDSLRRLRRLLYGKRLSPHNGYYNLTLTNQQADELSEAGRDELVYVNVPGNGLAIIEGFRIMDIGWEVSLLDPEPAGRSSLVSGTVPGDNLDVVEGQANGEGQGIGLDDANLGAVEPGVRGEGTRITMYCVEHRDAFPVDSGHFFVEKGICRQRDEQEQGD